MDNYRYTIGRLRGSVDYYDILMKMADAKDLQSAFMALSEIGVVEQTGGFDIELIVKKIEGEFFAMIEKLLPNSLEVKNLISFLRGKSNIETLTMKTYMGKKFVESIKVFNFIVGMTKKERADTAHIITKFKFSDFALPVEKGIDQFKKNQTLFALEKEFDNYIIKIAKREHFAPDGASPVVAFLILKYYEMKSLKMILESKKIGLNSHDIKDRVRGQQNGK